MAGRKSVYEDRVQPYLNDINKKIQEGVTEAQICKELGVSVATFSNYKLKYPELKEALKNKGKAVLEKLINAGVKSACGYFEENETTTIVLDENGKPSKKQKVITKTWYPPNPALNKFYVQNYGKDEGWIDSPLDYELKKAKQEIDEQMLKNKNWDVDF